MGIFSSIMDKIFNRDTASAASGSSATGSPTASTQGTASSQTSASAAAATSSRPTAATVDVEAVLSGMAAGEGQKLDWRRSIVDLMKLLDLDSSLSARKELAQELGYTGDMNDSAKMNVWLHKQVMQKLAENGGKVPESLRT
jgi:hypothetical protein